MTRKYSLFIFLKKLKRFKKGESLGKSTIKEVAKMAGVSIGTV